MTDRPEQLGLDFGSIPHPSGVDEVELRQRAERGIGEYLARRRRVWPEMPIARIMKALERQGISAELAPRALELIGASVTRIPEYVAKFNFRVTFPQAVLDRCRQVYQEQGDF
ncbi:MAG: hypothetical protein HY314_14565 [Acidobacteria bacterium]|nr:hypothetical protein [Acidobacteriota bacterium]